MGKRWKCGLGWLVLAGLLAVVLTASPVRAEEPEKVLIGGLTVYLLSSIACALAPGLAWLVVARFAQAIGCCTGVVVARAIIRDAHSAADGARVLAKASSLLSLAAISGPVLGSYLQVAFGFGVLGTLWFAWRGRDSVAPTPAA